MYCCKCKQAVQYISTKSKTKKKNHKNTLMTTSSNSNEHSNHNRRLRKLCDLLVNDLGVSERAFGVVGIPITPLIKILQQVWEIPFYAFRNETGASYAASVDGYLNGSVGCSETPGFCFTVSGPGMIHALPGLANAASNNWPMVLISSGPSTKSPGYEEFQSAPLLQLAKPLCRKVLRLSFDSNASSIDWEGIERQFTEIRMAALGCDGEGRLIGPAGPCFIEIGREWFADDQQRGEDNFVCNLRIRKRFSTIPRSWSPVNLPTNLYNCQRPLLIIGAEYLYHIRNRSEIMPKNNNSFLSGIPFITNPMASSLTGSSGYGLCVNSARRFALSNADLIIVIGAKWDWMIAPSISGDCCIIFLELYPLTNAFLPENSFTVPFEQLKSTEIALNIEDWKASLHEAMSKNTHLLEKKISSATSSTRKGSHKSLNYYSVLGALRQTLLSESIPFILVAEGANTMDMTRLIGPQALSKMILRIDAGSFATMGMSIPAMLTAQLNYPAIPILAVIGDSALGFSLPELETLARYQTSSKEDSSSGILLLIVNNDGIYGSYDTLTTSTPASRQDPCKLTPELRYEKVAHELLAGAARRGECVIIRSGFEDLVLVARRLWASTVTERAINVLHVCIETKSKL